MKIYLALTVLGVLAARAIGGEVSPATNAGQSIRRSDLVAARARLAPRNFLQMATNTPAFEEYGFKFMLGIAEDMRDKCQIGLSRSLSVSNVYFYLQVRPAGISGAIFTRDGRFRWSFDANRLRTFWDTNYYPFSFDRDDAKARLVKIKSRITAPEAGQIAQTFLHQLGLTEAQLNLEPTPVVTQYQFENPNGTIQPLPAFKIQWREKPSAKDLAAAEFRKRHHSRRGWDVSYFIPLIMFVSGITKQVSEYSSTSGFAPRFPLPANYYDMLGVKPPTNFDQRIGFKPLEKLPPAHQFSGEIVYASFDMLGLL